MLLHGARRRGGDPISQAGTRIAIGKARDGNAQRPWRAAPYAPAGRYSLYRVTFKEGTEEAWTWTIRTAPTELPGLNWLGRGRGLHEEGCAHTSQLAIA